MAKDRSAEGGGTMQILEISKPADRYRQGPSGGRRSVVEGDSSNSER
jgi:hypothetical protein